jgi:nicotinamidase-related amidase
LKLGTPSTEITPEVAPLDGDIVLVKKRISVFYGTELERTLRDLSIGKISLAGVATDLAVQSAARDAHDRDFEVEVIANCCAAANDADHEAALITMKKFAAVR